MAYIKIDFMLLDCKLLTKLAEMKWSTAFFLLYSQEEESNKKKKRNDYRKQLSLAKRRLRQRKLPRVALEEPLLPNMSWNKLFDSGNDKALITLTGFNHRSFRQLEELFEPFWMNCLPYGKDGRIRFLSKPYDMNSRGRPRKLTARINLGLVLTWTRTRGAQFSNQMHFGLTGTPLSYWIKFGIRVLNFILKKNPMAKVTRPPDEDMEQFIDAIGSKYPLLDEEHVWCVCDGLKLYVQKAGDPIKQSYFYNGWTCKHYMNCLFVFIPNGTIDMCLINAPGSIHDSTMAKWGDIYSKLETIYEQMDAKCVVDSAFSKSWNFGCLIKSAQSINENMDARAIRLNTQATSVLQATEWGMRAIQGSFPQLKDEFPYEKTGLRKNLLSLVVLLYNYRARTVGLNQIKSTFMSELEKDANDLMIG
jgi:hypothetical protein